MKTSELTLYALLVACAMMLSYVESLLPVFVAVPGVKAGLANIAIVFALYKLGAKAAILVSIIRIALSALLFGNAFSAVYSLAGAVLSLSIMILLKATKKISLVTVSVCGAVMHNAGQLIVALFVLKSQGLIYYMAPLTISGIISGIIIGIAAALVSERIKLRY